MGRSLEMLQGRFAICRMAAGADLPTWVTRGWVSMTRSRDELSVICGQDDVPDGIHCDRDWCGLRLAGSFLLSDTGVLAPLASALAEANVPLLVVGTFETDYLFVPASRIDEAHDAFRRAGCTLVEPTFGDM